MKKKDLDEAMRIKVDIVGCVNDEIYRFNINGILSQLSVKVETRILKSELINLIKVIYYRHMKNDYILAGTKIF